MVALLLLAGCTGSSDDAEPTPTTQSSTSVGPTSDPTPTEPVEPTLPPEAEGSSPRAAKAFVGYYIELLNYAANSGDTRTFAGAASESCSLCTDYVDLFESTYERGGFMRTRGFEIRRIGLGASDQERTYVSVDVESRPVTYKRSADSPTKRSKAQQYSLSFGLRALDKGWRVEVWEET